MVDKEIVVGKYMEKENYIPILVEIACTFHCDIMVLYDEKEINLRSILSVASLDAKEGESIVLVADGPDERSAIIALSHYFSS